MGGRALSGKDAISIRQISGHYSGLSQAEASRAISRLAPAQPCSEDAPVLFSLAYQGQGGVRTPPWPHSSCGSEDQLKCKLYFAWIRSTNDVHKARRADTSNNGASDPT